MITRIFNFHDKKRKLWLKILASFNISFFFKCSVKLNSKEKWFVFKKVHEHGCISKSFSENFTETLNINKSRVFIPLPPNICEDLSHIFCHPTLEWLGDVSIEIFSYLWLCQQHILVYIVINVLGFTLLCYTALVLHVL